MKNISNLTQTKLLSGAAIKTALFRAETFCKDFPLNACYMMELLSMSILHSSFHSAKPQEVNCKLLMSWSGEQEQQLSLEPKRQMGCGIKECFLFHPCFHPEDSADINTHKQHWKMIFLEILTETGLATKLSNIRMELLVQRQHWALRMLLLS